MYELGNCSIFDNFAVKNNCEGEKEWQRLTSKLKISYALTQLSEEDSNWINEWSLFRKV